MNLEFVVWERVKLRSLRNNYDRKQLSKDKTSLTQRKFQ